MRSSSGVARGRAVAAGLAAALLAAVLAAAAAGCGGEKRGVAGGTLRVAGSSDVDHLDTAAAYSTWSGLLARQYARTLFGFAASGDFAEAAKVRPDVALEVPTPGNGGVSPDGRTYTIRLRDGVRWNTDPPREVTAADFVRGIKRVCNPAVPSGGRAYYTETIAGMAEFCAGYADVDPRSAAAMARYQRTTDVAGLAATDAKTLVVTLERPASDFPELLALEFAAAAPAEYDRYVPDSPEFRRHTVSDGPYQITSYTPGKRYVLERNRTWRAASDPIRAQHPDRIEITLGHDSPEEVQRLLENGDADLSWDQPVPSAAIPRLREDARFAVMEGSALSPYLVFNTLSPNNGGALGKVEVRRAISYAVDKAAVVRIHGGPDIAEVLHQVIPPRSVGHQEFDLYPTPGDAGDPAACRRMLARAGYPRGLTLRFPYRVSGNHPRTARSIADDLAACGIATETRPDTSGAFYSSTLATPADARAGKWDIAAPGWVPDWYGNNGRTTIVPLFDGRHYGPNSTDYGGFDDPAVDRLIDQALGARDVADASGFWAQADRRIMESAPVVPLINPRTPIFRSARVENARYLPQYRAYDLNQVTFS
ncbi:ABC transporter substrate-binding protein [Actinomadura geliboluensis]|uniref:ABC transporter substrate-binding protein n=1 Tax=Actinomadura geliboluensis TaxID=882440 RepID=UPI003674608C